MHAFFGRRKLEQTQYILLYIRRDNPAAARRLLAAINDTLRLLSVFSRAGAVREDLSQGLRSFPVCRYRNYLIFYRIRSQQIEIIHVLHGARDLREFFNQN